MWCGSGMYLRLKHDGRMLAATEGGQVYLAREATAAQKATQLWKFTEDGVVSNVFHGLHLQVPRNQQAVVIGNSDNPGAFKKWKVTSDGEIHLTSDSCMCLCIPNGSQSPEVRPSDSDVETAGYFHWEFIAEDGKLLQPLECGVTEQTDYPLPQFGYPTPGPQTPTVEDVVTNAFFVHEKDWNAVRESGDFDFVVVGSGFCCLGFVTRVLTNNPYARILILERGSFLLPEHFQNLPMPFQKTLKGVSETFPWSVTEKTHKGRFIKFQHGVVPFLGGRSTTWSGWCPEPMTEELVDWPKEAVETIHRYFREVEELLNVVPANKINKSDVHNGSKPIFGALQKGLETFLQLNAHKSETITRCIAAPLAVGSTDTRYVPYHKFSVPGPLLELMQSQKEKAAIGRGWTMKLAANCVVERVLHEGGRATALETSRGKINLGEAKLILAMGSLPPVTLILNSFPKTSFPGLANVGERFTGHSVSVVIARVPKDNLPYGNELGDLDLGAIYIAGVEPSSGAQYHIQLSAATSANPFKDAKDAFHHMPDVRASPSQHQIATSKDHVVFVCAVLGELDHRNKDNWFRLNGESNPCENIELQVVTNQQDESVWDTMERATFEVLEKVLGSSGGIEYWHETANSGVWQSERPPIKQIRGSGVVHEASSMWFGDKEDTDAPIGLDYRPRGVENVYITGAALYPRCGSWNPTGPMVALAMHLADMLSPPPPVDKN